MSEEKKIAECLANFISESAVRAVRLETNQEHLTNAVTEMTKTHQEIMAGNIRLEEKIISLESKAVDHLSDVDKTIRGIDVKVERNTCRLADIEVKIAAVDAANEVRNQYKAWWSSNWSKIVMLLVLSVPAIVAIFNIVKTVKG